MKLKTFNCPHCGNSLGYALDAYLYGSPLQVCDRCKKTYVDRRYHEIAVEGIRQEDIDPTEEDKKMHRKGGWIAVGIGVAAIAVFVLLLAAGWISFPLPIIGVISLIGGIVTMRGDNKKVLEKTRKNLENERQQSMQRMQDPRYVAQLYAIGYIKAPGGEAQTIGCPKCGAPMNPEDRFCANCGASVNLQ